MCIEFVKEENENNISAGNSMILNSPLIPTITTKPYFGSNVLKLKYTLPSGVIIYSPKTAVPNKKPETIIAKDDLANPNINIKEVCK